MTNHDWMKQEEYYHERGNKSNFDLMSEGTVYGIKPSKHSESLFKDVNQAPYDREQNEYQYRTQVNHQQLSVNHMRVPGICLDETIK
mmetsp:Transcript_58174/g.66401  ORF Transcript_58174/g.66401 Transcript_58174/m.66401 type:complete len:87 (+) Transcript_58174:223-483(+)